MRLSFINTARAKIAFTFILLPIWYLAYHFLQPFTDWLVFSAFAINKGEHFSEALWFFIYELPRDKSLIIANSIGLISEDVCYFLIEKKFHSIILLVAVIINWERSCIVVIESQKTQLFGQYPCMMKVKV